jgi:hypothetical protein
MKRALNIVINPGVGTTCFTPEDIRLGILRIKEEVIESMENLSVCRIDLTPFTPHDCNCLPNSWIQLSEANTQMVALVESIVSKRPSLFIRLERPKFLAEAQVTTIWRPFVDSTLAAARGNVISLHIGCPLDWLLRWLPENKQLQELNVINTARQEIAQVWDVGRCEPKKLMLDGFKIASIDNFPQQLVELVWTHLDNTVVATNKILAHFPNLQVLSLIFEEIPGGFGKREAEDCLEGHKIVCVDLRTVWWTKSSAPERVVSVVAAVCPSLESISPPQNVTNEDLIALFQRSKILSEIWLLDCPKITEDGFRALKDLKHVRLHKQLARFLACPTLTEFLENNPSLEHLEVVLDGNDEELSRREFGEAVGGAVDHQERLFSVMTFKSNMIGDEFSFDLEALRKMMGIHKEEGFGGVKGVRESTMSGDFLCNNN